MLKRAGKLADNFESEALPKCDGALAGTLERVRAHRASYASAGCPGSGDVSGIGHVRAAAVLIGLQKIRAHNVGVLFRGEDVVPGSEPILECFLARHVSRQRVRITCANGRLQNRPNRIGIGVRRSGTNLHSSLSQRRRYYVNLTQQWDNTRQNLPHMASFVRLLAWRTSSARLPRRSARSRKDSV